MESLINYSLLITINTMPIVSNSNLKVTGMQRGELIGTFSSFLDSFMLFTIFLRWRN